MEINEGKTLQQKFEELTKKYNDAIGYNNMLQSDVNTLQAQIKKMEGQIGYLQNNNGFKKLDFLFAIVVNKDKFSRGSALVGKAENEIEEALFPVDDKEEESSNETA